jgi:hypothetical protein
MYFSADFVWRNQVESWVTDNAGREMQKRVWDSVSRRLNTIQPGCV